MLSDTNVRMGSTANVFQQKRSKMDTLAAQTGTFQYHNSQSAIEDRCLVTLRIYKLRTLMPNDYNTVQQNVGGFINMFSNLRFLVENNGADFKSDIHVFIEESFQNILALL